MSHPNPVRKVEKNNAARPSPSLSAAVLFTSSRAAGAQRSRVPQRSACRCKERPLMSARCRQHNLAARCSRVASIAQHIDAARGSQCSSSNHGAAQPMKLRPSGRAAARCCVAHCRTLRPLRAICHIATSTSTREGRFALPAPCPTSNLRPPAPLPPCPSPSSLFAHVTWHVSIAGGCAGTA